jgi:hypothetical protein
VTFLLPTSQIASPALAPCPRTQIASPAPAACPRTQIASPAPAACPRAHAGRGRRRAKRVAGEGAATPTLALSPSAPFFGKRGSIFAELPFLLGDRCATALASISGNRFFAALRMTDSERRPFSVILNGGCRSEESLTTSARSVTQSSPLAKGPGVRSPASSSSPFRLRPVRQRKHITNV